MKNRKQLFLVVCMFFVMVLISSNERASCEVLDSSKGMASLNTIGNVPFIKNTTQNNTLLSEKKKVETKNILDSLQTNAVGFIDVFQPLSIETKDSTLYVGEKWNPEDNFVHATDEAGKKVSW
ncbi:bacterial Ig-like domain-containing protein, partial [Enterococcus faecalis]